MKGRKAGHHGKKPQGIKARKGQHEEGQHFASGGSVKDDCMARGGRTKKHLGKKAGGGAVSEAGEIAAPSGKQEDKDDNEEDAFARGGGIHIKKSHRGMLHRELGVSSGSKIPAGKLEKAKHSSDPAERKRATFAINAKSWHKG